MIKQLHELLELELAAALAFGDHQCSTLDGRDHGRWEDFFDDGVMLEQEFYYLLLVVLP